MTEDFGTWEVIGLYHYIETNSPSEYLDDFANNIKLVVFADHIAKYSVVLRSRYGN